MIYDVHGRVISSASTRNTPTPSQGKKPVGPIISAGGVEFGGDNDSKLKSALLSNLSQRKRTQKRKSAPLVQRSGRLRDTPEYGKAYPGARPLIALRAMAWSSTVVYSILTYRRHQLTKREIMLRPKDQEPSFRFHIMEYSPSEIMRHPAFDDVDKHGILSIFLKVDPLGEQQRKLSKYEQMKGDMSRGERDLVEYYNQKQLKFHRDRNEDKRNILKLLRDPDPYFSEESSWYYLISNALEDLLLIDRGAVIKVRNDDGKIIALTPIDGTTLRPHINDQGFIEHYLQVVDGQATREYIDRRDVILLRANISPDVYMYGYGIPNMDILWTTVLSDLYIDKGNVDYYRKGGSVPEGFLTVEPPMGAEDMYVQYDKEQLDAIQRQLQAFIMSDFTQVPIVSGGRFSWIDLKGKRRDMQFKELAEYLTRKICAVFQVSPQDVGVLHDVNRSSSETQASLTKSKGLETIASLISHYITTGVIDEMREEKDLQLWFQEDDNDAIKDWWATVQGQLQTGYKSVNEVRSEQGEDPVPWGDTPLQGLRNWVSEEAMAGQQGGPGAPGGAPMPPGLDQVAAAGGGPSPTPVPGQIPDVAPALGQAPALKSVLTELLEPSFSDTYSSLDVEPIIKNLFSSAVSVANVSTSLFTDVEEVDEDEDFTDSITESVEYFLGDSIKEAGVSVGDSLGTPTLHIRVPAHLYKRDNFFKIAMYLVKFGGDSNLVDVSPQRAVMHLNDVTVLPEIGGKGTYLQTVTSVLRGLSFSQGLRVEFTHEEFDVYVAPIEEGDNLKRLFSRIKGQTAVTSLLSAANVGEELAEVAVTQLEKIAKKGRVSLPDFFPTFRAALTKDLTERIIALVRTADGVAADYYQRLFSLYSKHRKVDGLASVYDEIYPYQQDLKDALDTVVTAYAKKGEGMKKQVYRELYARMHAFRSDTFTLDERPETTAIRLLALQPSVGKVSSLEEGVLRITELARLKETLNKDLASYKIHGEPHELASEGFSGESYFISTASIFQNFVRQYDAYGGTDDAELDSLSEELQELAEDFSDFFYGLEVSPFWKIEQPVEKIIREAVNQTAALFFIKLEEYDNVRAAFTNMLFENGLTVDLGDIVFTGEEDMDGVISVVTVAVAEEYGVPDDLMLKSLITKITSGDDLTQFDTTMLRLMREAKTGADSLVK